MKLDWFWRDNDLDDDFDDEPEEPEEPESPVGMTGYLCVTIYMLGAVITYVILKQWTTVLVSIAVLLLYFAFMTWETRWFRCSMTLVKVWPWVLSMALITTMMFSTARIRWERTAMITEPVCGTLMRMGEYAEMSTDSEGRGECRRFSDPTYAFFKAYWDDPALLWRGPRPQSEITVESAKP